jgi:ribosomal-protein-alanine N-acetyltransferase
MKRDSLAHRLPRPATLPRIRLERISLGREREFLAAVRRSRGLHRPWSSPPATPAAFRRHVAALSGPRCVGYFVLTSDGALSGAVHVTEIVRGVFRSAYLGFHAFAPHHGRGHMTAGLAAVVVRAFRVHRLHRLEANIQPGNAASIALVKRLGFRREGYSPRYLKIRGRWRDHERWAITAEEWRHPARGARHHRR